MLVRPQGDTGVAADSSSSSQEGLRPKRTTRFDFLLSSSLSSGPSLRRNDHIPSESSPLEPLSDVPSVASSRPLPLIQLSHQDNAAPFESSSGGHATSAWTELQRQKLNMISRNDSIWQYTKERASATSSSLSTVIRLRHAASRSRASSLAGDDMKSARSEGTRTPAMPSAALTHLVSPRKEQYSAIDASHFRSRLSHMVESERSAPSRGQASDSSVPSQDSTLVSRPAPTSTNMSRVHSTREGEMCEAPVDLNVQAYRREKQALWKSETGHREDWQPYVPNEIYESRENGSATAFLRTKGRSREPSLRNSHGRNPLTEGGQNMILKLPKDATQSSIENSESQASRSARMQPRQLNERSRVNGSSTPKSSNDGTRRGVRKQVKVYSEESTVSHTPPAEAQEAAAQTGTASLHSTRLHYQSSGQILMRRLIEDMRYNVNNGPRMVRSLSRELAQSGFQDLISFTHRHNDQVALWVEAFNHWETFIGSILNSLSQSNCLRPEDGAQVLDVLPSPVLLYIYRRRYKSDLLPVMPLEARQLCMIPHVAQMGLTLVSVLSAAHEYLKCLSTIQLVTRSVQQLGNSRLIVDLFKSIRIFINSFPANHLREKSWSSSLQNSARLSLYTLIKFAHETTAMENFLQSFVFSNPTVIAQILHGKLCYAQECRSLFECQSSIEDEVEGVVTKTSLFLGGIGSCLAMHLTSLQALEESLDSEISRMKDLEQQRHQQQGDFVFKNFDVRVPPFSAVPQLQFVSTLIHKLNGEYSMMQRQIAQVVGRLLGITEFTQNSQGPQPPVSMLVETLSCFLTRVDECLQQLLATLNISESDLSQTATEAMHGPSRICLPTIADFFGV